MLPPPEPRAPQTIRIDPEVWFALQKLAVPFVETPNDVLRRLLGLSNPAEGTETPQGRAQSSRAKGGKRSLFFVNTDAKTGANFHDEWLARGIAVTSGEPRYRDSLANVSCGDTVLMYVNRIGVVAVGITLDDRVTVAEEKDLLCPENQQEQIKEYHRRVEWHCDLRSTPITPAKIKELCGQTPIQTVQRVRKGEDEFRRLLLQVASAHSSDEVK
jgi:hypothetical protein